MFKVKAMMLLVFSLSFLVEFEHLDHTLAVEFISAFWDSRKGKIKIIRIILT